MSMLCKLFGHRRRQEERGTYLVEVCDRCPYLVCVERFEWCGCCQKLRHESELLVDVTGYVCMDCITGLFHDYTLN